MKNRKGFTLVELLAVIVILAVVMLIGVTAVLPLISKAQKSSLASEGLGLIETGKTAFQSEQLASSTLGLKSTDSYCFSIDWLKSHNYYDKSTDIYSGSVYVYFNEAGKYEYYFWITNGAYYISAGTNDEYEIREGNGGDGICNCGGNGGGTTDHAPREMQCNIMEGYGYLPIPSGFNIEDCNCTYSGIGNISVSEVYGYCSKKISERTNLAIVTPYYIGTLTTSENWERCEIYRYSDDDYSLSCPNSETPFSMNSYNFYDLNRY